MNHATGGWIVPHFDPEARLVHLPKNPTPYELAHERAHEAQQQYRTRVWRLFELAGRWPIVARLIRLLVEWQAARMALKALQYGGRADRHARAEARAGLWSYVQACFGRD